ncbi:MAG: HAMP domain-containing protein [Chitinophagaceae bacterium]|nr:HAMP domain-containing protein [Anaerolineae bacterium]
METNTRLLTNHQRKHRSRKSLPQFKLTSLRTRLFLFVLVLVIPGILLVLVNANIQRMRDGQTAQQDAQRFARLAANYQNQQIEAGRQLLNVLAQMPYVRSMETTECSQALRDLLTYYPNYTNFSVTDLDGNTFCSANPPPQGMNSVGIAWFDRVLDTSDFAVGDFMVGRVTLKPIVVLAFPVIDETGEMIAIMAIGMNLDWLSTWLGQIDLPNQSTLTIITYDSTILAHYPEGDQDRIGQKMAPSDLLTAATSQNEGTLSLRGEDGRSYFYAFTHSGNETNPTTMIVGIPRAVALAQANRQQAEYLIGLMIFTLAALSLGWLGANLLVIQPIDHLILATEKLAAGDLRARTILPNNTEELDRLAFAFNQLAASLEQREADVDQFTSHLKAEIEERKQMQEALHRFVHRLAEETNAREKAQEADDLKLRFLAMITHELRTPLTSIKGFATTLMADDVEWDHESQVDFMQIIDEETDRLLEMVEQLLDLSQIEAGALRIRRITSNLNEVVAMAMVRFNLLTENHTLQIIVPDQLPLMEIDPQRIMQVLVNLVSNAAKYSPPGTEIILRAKVSDETLLIEVRDHGGGISSEDRSQVFKAFTRAKNNKAKGTGVGLAICKGIVEAHGGRIWILESSAGSGTTIAVMLPIKEPIGVVDQVTDRP